MLRKNKDNVNDRALIKVTVPYLRNLIGNGVELVYKEGFNSSAKGFRYWKNFGSWTKNIKNYKLVVLGENHYNFDVSRYIKRVNPKCKIIVFFWNKIKIEWYKGVLEDPNVDEYYTFDEDEAKQYNFKLTSTFYSKGLKLPNNKIENDILFLGRAKDREKEILNIEKQIKKQNIKTDFRIIKDEKDYIDYYEYLALLSKSKAILDYNAYNQSGLSLRTMEALFFKKKLVTSNKNIKNYDFYNKNNIFIIKEDNWKNLNKFINSDYEDVPEEIVNYYDFDEWIKRFE